MESIKKYKKTLILTAILILLPMLIGFIFWDKLPDQLATHFGSNGEPDGWSSKTFAVIVLPVLLVAVHLACFFITFADPKKQHIDPKLFKLILWLCPVISWFGCGTTYAHALDMEFNITNIGMILVGVLFIIIGNYLPKARQNYTVGIKLPWTLHDEENWNRTHRLAGKLWMVCGLLFVIVSFFGLGISWIAMILGLIMVFVPAGYSFLYYLKNQKNE